MYTKKSDLPFIIDDQTFSKFFLFFFIFETSSDCVLTYNHVRNPAWMETTV